MEVFVNNISLPVFEGARAIDAVRSYYTMLHSPVPEPLPLIVDNFGNTIEPDGALSPHNHIYLPDNTNTEPYD